MNKDTIFGDKVERAIVEEIVENYSAQGMSHIEFARRLYGDTSTAPGKWRRIRNISPTGKPQSLPVAEAVAAARLLGLDFYALVFRVEEKLKITN